MDITQQFQILQSAQGEPAKLALATVDLAYPDLPLEERVAVRESLEAAAIPHWCDGIILAKLLGISQSEGTAQIDALRNLKILETFPARGKSAVNVNRSARLSLRKWLAVEEYAKFQEMSARSAAYFKENNTPAARVEWIYHLLCADPEMGAYELEKFDRESKTKARPEDDFALAVALAELIDTALVDGRAKLWALLSIALTRESRGEATQVVDLALEALDLARSLSDEHAEAQAQALLGSAYQSRGDLGGAKTAYGKYLKLTSCLLKRNVNNNDWHQDLAVAYSRVGDVLQAQGKLNEAQKSFEEELRINKYLVEKDPDNPGWQKDLAVAHSKVGDVLRMQGYLDDAQKEFEKRLVISKKLAKLDQKNGDWQRGLAVAFNWIGIIQQSKGNLNAAQEAFNKNLEICLQLSEQDPNNASWQRELAVSFSKMGDVLREQECFDKALIYFKKRRVISQYLVDLDPTNTMWQRGLALAHAKVGEVQCAQGSMESALSAFNESLEITKKLVKIDSDNAGWQRALAKAHWRIADLEVREGEYKSALEFYEVASRIYSALNMNSLEIAAWAEEKKEVESKMTICRSRVAEEK